VFEKMFVMKNNIIALGMVISIMVLSCHKAPAPARLSCCAKDGAVVASSLTGSLEANASLYQLPGEWTDAHNHSLELKALKGKIQVVAMIFTHCGYACPRLVQDMKAIEDALPAAVRNDVGYVLVSFDTERDGPAQLGRFAGQQGLDERWVLLHGGAEQIRELSMLLNVRYQRLEDGNFNHSNSIFILDKKGKIIQSLDGFESQAGLAVNAISRLVNN
jgi:protein SCO1/2